MNERIRELAEQCRFEIQGINCEVLGQGFDEEKFAELVVRECADVLLKWKGEPFPFDEDLAANLIKEHFGVEE